MRTILQLNLPTLGRPANDNRPALMLHKGWVRIYANLASDLEALSDRRRLSYQLSSKLRRYRRLHFWHSLWITVWYRCGGVCERCLTRPMAQLHHKHYRTYGQERPEDMEGLCSDCHWLHHRSRSRSA